MPGVSVRELWKERLVIFDVMYHWNNYVPLAVSPVTEEFGPSLQKVRTDLEEMLRQLPADILDWFNRNWDESIEALGPRREAFLAHLKKSDDPEIPKVYSNWRSSSPPTRYDEFVPLLERRLKEIDDALAQVPGGIEKAREVIRALAEWNTRESNQIYDAMVLLGDEIQQHSIDEEVANWKEDLRQHQKEHQDDPWGHVSAVFWNSKDNHELIDAVSRYCFMERFQIGEFAETETEIEYFVGSELLTGLSGLESHFAAYSGDHYFGRSTLALFFASRSKRLCRRIRHFIEIALVRVAHQQFLDGWYTDYSHTVELSGRRVAAPNIYLTALAAVCLFRLGRQQHLRTHGEKAVTWLAKQQQQDGSWTIIADGRNRKADVFTTVLALEAIRLSGLPGLRHSLAIGERWLLSAQRPSGEWDDGSSWPPYPFETVLVIEYFETGSQPTASSLPNYLRLARGFLDRASELALEDDPNAWRLAIVTGYHALEGFLYGILEHPSVNLRVFRNANNTIGPREAITKLEEHLRTLGNLSQGGHVVNRASLDRLAHLRDEIVHKAIGVSKEDSQEIIDKLGSFVNTYSKLILGYELQRT